MSEKNGQVPYNLNMANRLCRAFNDVAIITSEANEEVATLFENKSPANVAAAQLWGALLALQSSALANLEAADELHRKLLLGNTIPKSFSHLRERTTEKPEE